jgi:phosphoribosylformylglycinamidine cyclo-ligase
MRTKAYTRAGVDVDLANHLVSGLGEKVRKTHRPEVLGTIGGFGGLFRASFGKMRDPVLVSSIDGVGTKLKVASLLHRFDTIGEDLVNHCVNDILVLGAEPLFFLDYIGTTVLEPEMFDEIITGIVRGCRNAKCSLIGGETAQMPGIYHGRDFDLVGCIVGVVDRKKIVTGDAIRPGDAIVGLPSSGLHTNGYSLAREIIFNKLNLRVTDRITGMREPIGEALLRTHLSYLDCILKMRKVLEIRGMAHITGGGLVDNVPRILPTDCDAVFTLGSWPVPPLFRFLASETSAPDRELFQTFNMGIGMVIIVRKEDARQAAKIAGGPIIGRIVPGKKTVQLEAHFKKAKKMSRRSP